MAQQFQVMCYGKNGQSLGKPTGFNKAFPSQGVSIEPISPAVSIGGISCVTRIILFPAAAYPLGETYESPVAIATIVSAANA